MELWVIQCWVTNPSSSSSSLSLLSLCTFFLPLHTYLPFIQLTALLKPAASSMSCPVMGNSHGPFYKWTSSYNVHIWTSVFCGKVGSVGV